MVQYSPMSVDTIYKKNGFYCVDKSKLGLSDSEICKWFDWENLCFASLLYPVNNTEWFIVCLCICQDFLL